ncbi:MAG: hypothetical protein P1U53_07955 [Sulfitobacter sp.]|nr:hypothetical protein [Sulfitobacter sp.]
MKLSIKTITLLTGVLLMAACGSDDNNDDEVTGIDTFGAAFRAMFDADPNSEPVDAQTIDISVDPTADPFNP